MTPNRPTWPAMGNIVYGDTKEAKRRYQLIEMVFLPWKRRDNAREERWLPSYGRRQARRHSERSKYQEYLSVHKITKKIHYVPSA